MITYRSELEDIDPSQLQGFFADWPQPPCAETHLEILRNSYCRVLAVDPTQPREHQIVGFIYALSDGILSAYIPLLEVRREYKNRGIGKELLRRLIVQLPKLYMIDLVCDPGLVPYYEKLGMSKLAGMAYRNRENLQGPC